MPQRRRASAHPRGSGCRSALLLASLGRLALLVLATAGPVRAEDAVHVVQASESVYAAGDTVTASAQAAADGGVYQLVLDAASRWGIDPQYWLGVAWCESRQGQDPNAYLPQGRYVGVFQFTGSTWAWASQAAGWGGASPYDDRANVEVASWLFVVDGPGHWPICANARNWSS
jgi:hypothetical protein